MKLHTQAVGEASPHLNCSLATFDWMMLPCNEDFVKEEVHFTTVLEIS
jgi:hypothetical protein